MQLFYMIKYFLHVSLAKTFYNTFLFYRLESLFVFHLYLDKIRIGKVIFLLNKT